MNIAIVGLGNVGSSLLLALPEILGADDIEKVYIIGRSPGTSNGGLLDVASAFPIFASRCIVADKKELSQADLIIFCAGTLKEKGESRVEHFKKNAHIFSYYFDGIPLEPSAILVVVPSPVDDLTVFAAAFCKLERSRVFGFGGDLDFRRLQYSLIRDRQTVESVAIVGEHGPRVIPVYSDEIAFDKLAEEIRTFLSKTHNEVGRPRNLSSGVLLSKLVSTILTDSGARHFLCGYHSEYKIYLTWPFSVGLIGLGEAQTVALGPRSQPQLLDLIEDRLASTLTFQP